MALREGWNAHNDVGLEIEHIARRELHHEGNHSGEFTNADQVEHGTFVEAMMYILRTIKGPKADLSKFAEKCAPFFAKDVSEIPDELADELVREFKHLVRQ